MPCHGWTTGGGQGATRSRLLPTDIYNQEYFMALRYTHVAPSYGHHFPLIDTEFDRFEINRELEETLR
jgi:hypothetical protein